MTILPTLALRSFVGFDNLFNELESISNQKQSSFPAHDIVRISDDEYEITLAVSGFNKKDISIDVHDGVLTIKEMVDLKFKMILCNIYIKVLQKDLLNKNLD